MSTTPETSAPAPDAFQEGVRVIVGGLIALLLLIAAMCIAFLLYYPREPKFSQVPVKAPPAVLANEVEPPLALLPLGVDVPAPAKPAAVRAPAREKPAKKFKERRPPADAFRAVEASGG